MGNSRLFTMKDWEKLQADILMPYIERIKEEADAIELAKVTVPPQDTTGTEMPQEPGG